MQYTEANVGAASFLWMAIDVSGFGFKQMDGYDSPGFDIGSARGKDIDACVEKCIAKTKCFAVTWTNYEGGTCWMKGRANTFAPSAGAVSALVARRAQLGASGACPRL